MSTATSTRPNGHEAHRKVGAKEAQCPYCGAPLTRAEYRKITERITSEEKARLAKLEQSLRAKFARERHGAAVATQQAIEKAKKDAAAQVEKVRKEAAARAA